LRASGRRSKLEETCEGLLTEIGVVQYEPDKLPFVQPAVERYYVPDFKLGKDNYVEVKGRLTLEDRKKMLWVKEQHPDKLFRIIFGNGNNKITKKSRTTYLDWALENGFEAIDVKDPIPTHWFKEKDENRKPKKTR
jgi:hypothetical protein